MGQDKVNTVRASINEGNSYRKLSFLHNKSFSKIEKAGVQVINSSLPASDVKFPSQGQLMSAGRLHR